MAGRASNFVFLCVVVMHVHQKSAAFNSTYQTLLIPCEKDGNWFTFPNDTESYLRVYSNQLHLKYVTPKCMISLQVPAGKFLSIKTQPYESTSTCSDISVSLQVERKININPCDTSMIYHSPNNNVQIRVAAHEVITVFSVTIAVRALDKDGRKNLRVTHHTNLSGTITPYGFDGFVDYARCMYAFASFYLPSGYSIMLSFPVFHIKPSAGCYWSLFEMQIRSKWGGQIWGHCGNLQLSPKLYAVSTPLWFGFYTREEKGYIGFKVRYSFHGLAALPNKIASSDNTTAAAVFNCSVPFFDTFSQHLKCNLETECVQAEDEVSCPYRQGDCQPDFLNAGGRCYKYVRTRKRMTWYDASAACLKQGLTLASFPTFMQGEAFRDGLLRYAPITFKTYIGLRTSESSLPAFYREVWQWSSGVMAYYIDTDKQQLFKPTCGSFAALYRTKISTTLCGFYEYMHYIFCEIETPDRLASPPTITLSQTKVNSTFSRVKNKFFVVCSEGHVMHDFLSCDHESRCAAEPGVKSCVTNNSIKSDPAVVKVLMYACDSQIQTIHYTQVCDHQPQCFDGSDESFCVYRACLEKQCLNRQCVTSAQWCDGMTHCSDGSDEACPQFMTVSAKPPSAAILGFHVVLFDGFGKYQFIPQGQEFPVCPPTHFMCANRELCLPVYLRCNDVYDCADQEDEDNCQSARCPGFYRCRQSAVCVHSDHVCDGVFQCPQQDDELLCDQVCPENCLCQGLAFVCPLPFYAQAYPDVRYLDASGSGLPPGTLVNHNYLIRLSLAWCRLNSLPVLNFPNLKFLYLDSNNLKQVNMNVFLNLLNLQLLSLSGNPISKLVAPASNVLLENVHLLDLSYTRLKYFDSRMLWNVRNLKNLNISHGMLKIIGDSSFRLLTELESLDLRGSNLKEYPVKMLLPLSFLRILYTDVYKLCCREVLPKQINTENCHTSRDVIASCKDLLRSDIYRLFLWISCCLAAFGNAGSFAAKLYLQRRKTANSFDVFITNLNVADFLMGLYLVAIGSADQVYRGKYLWHDEEWKTSAGCRTAGFFSLLSCEMSAFIICFLTLDRFLVILFPLSHLRFSKKSALVGCGLSWVAGIALAALPLLPVTSHWEFYSQTDICIPLPVTKQDFKGHAYSFAILIVFNFFLFIFIAVGQMLIYSAIRYNSMETEQKIKRETAVARRLQAVVMSNFLCWFPIGLCGLLASNGVSIPGEVNVVLAIFALPINSALDPFLYTFNLVMEKRRKASEERLWKLLQKRHDDTK